MTFGETMKELRKRAGKSRYRLAQFSGVDQAYLLRLEAGERNNPSRDLVLTVALSLVQDSAILTLDDVDEMLLSAGYAPLRGRSRYFDS